MSRIALDHIDTEPVVFDERAVMGTESLGEDVVSADEAHIVGSVEHAGEGFVVAGDVRGGARLRCARCLEPFPFVYDEPFEVRLLPVDKAPTEEETRLVAGALDVRFYEEPVLDLAELAAEQFLLAVPMKPLCSGTCRGLCPRCGTNLNRGDCSCLPETDDRWAPLEDWRPSN